jgi:hypothetical protein
MNYGGAIIIVGKHALILREKTFADIGRKWRKLSWNAFV